jgi:hypothetical protein
MVLSLGICCAVDKIVDDLVLCVPGLLSAEFPSPLWPVEVFNSLWNDLHAPHSPLGGRTPHEA